MHRSWFSYPVSKPYPFRWFTPVALVGGVVLAVVLSLFNLSANGYYLKTIYTSDPNGTEAVANAQWFRKRPFNWQDDVQAECQPHLLSVGDSFFTSNLGFRYTVKAIADSDKNSRSTISYKNNTLQGCYPTNIQLMMKKVDTAVPPSPAWWMSWLDSNMEATVECQIVTDDGLVDVMLVTAGTGDGGPEYNYVVDDDYKTRASVWWGTRLLNTYWSGVMSTASHMTEIRKSKRYAVRAGFYYKTKNNQGRSIKSNNFFDLYWWISKDDSTVLNKDMKEGRDLVGYNSDWYGSPSLTEGLHTAKILHSLLSLDLGNCLAPNLLLDEKGLQYAILAPDNSNRAPKGLLNGSSKHEYGVDRYGEIPSPVPKSRDRGLVRLKDAYDRYRPLTGPLGCTNATIVTQYICSVPQKKSWVVLLFSMLLANLVFLQAAWKILTWTADSLVMRQNSEAMSCQGHQQGQLQNTSYQQLPDGPKPADNEEESLPHGR